MELATAGVIGAIGAVVATNAAFHDIGWSALGPQPGYFPFRIGLLLIVASVLLCVQALRAPDSKSFVERAALRRVLSVFVPTALLAAAMPLLGCYVPTALYLGWMMRRHGNYGWLRTAVTSVAITVAFYAVFELWFLVPLAKGPLEDALGIY